MEMKFVKYNSIENTNHAKTMAQIELQGIPTEDWVVQEKVHGANFSIWTNGEYVKFGKRSGFTGEDNFYNYQTIAGDLSKKIMRLFEMIQLYVNPKPMILNVYGELFGGSFKHPDVKNVDVKAIQKGIFYSPKIEFMAFDIFIDGLVVNVQDFVQYSRVADFFYAETLFRGTLQECLEYPNEYDSTIPKKLGYPKLTDNVCEGNVIRPFRPLYFGNGSRVILKNKNEKWSEKSKERKAPKTPVTLSDAGKEKVTCLNQYVTENRLRNVLSKIGEVTQKDFGRILGLMTQDILEEYNKDFDDGPNLEIPEDKLIKKLLNQEIGNLIRPNFRNMIDGMF